MIPLLNRYVHRVVLRPAREPRERRPGSTTVGRAAMLLGAACLALPWPSGANASTSDSAPLPIVELEPFMANGEPLSVSVFARSRGDRRYAERFADSVMELAYATIERSTGRGLIIVGGSGEPHPLAVFDTFVELKRQNRLEGELAVAAGDLETLLEDWRSRIDFSDHSGKSIAIDTDTLVVALPLPLEGVASSLYLLAWSRAFESQQVESALAQLRPEDLTGGELEDYDWVFYLPPRNAFDKVLKQLVPAMMKEAEIGFFKRVAVRGALIAFKPMVRDAVEAVRKGLLYFTILRARSDYTASDIEELTEAYIAAMLPRGKLLPGQKRQRALEAIEDQKVKNAEYAKNPFVSPERIEDPDLGRYSRFEGAYGYDTKPTHRFTLRDEACFWQYLDWEPGRFHPASDNLLVSEDGTMTIEFRYDPNGEFAGVEERWERRQNTIPRKL